MTATPQETELRLVDALVLAFRATDDQREYRAVELAEEIAGLLDDPAAVQRAKLAAAAICGTATP